jgi:hypothetical protein
MNLIDKIQDGWFAWFHANDRFAQYMAAKALYVTNFNHPRFTYPPFHRWKNFKDRRDEITFEKVYTAINKRPKRPQSIVCREGDTKSLGISRFDVTDTDIVMVTNLVMIKSELKKYDKGDEVHLAMYFENNDWKCSITHTTIDYHRPVTMYDDLMFVQGNIDKFEQDMITLLLTT